MVVIRRKHVQKQPGTGGGPWKLLMVGTIMLMVVVVIQGISLLWRMGSSTISDTNKQNIPPGPSALFKMNDPIQSALRSSRQSLGGHLHEKQDAPGHTTDDTNDEGHGSGHDYNGMDIYHEPLQSNEDQGSADFVTIRHGSDLMKVGYIKNFLEERNNPLFRVATSELADPNFNYYEHLENIISQQVHGTVPKVQACEQVAPDDILTLDEKCFDKQARLVAYNGANFSRYICGHELKPGIAILLDEECYLLPTKNHDALEVSSSNSNVTSHPPIRLWPNKTIPISGLRMPAISIVSTPPNGSSDTMPTVSFEAISCDIPCQWEKDMQGMDRYVVGTSWKVIYTDADPSSETRANIERTDYRHDLYYATTSWKSSVPLSSFTFDKFNIREAKAVDFDEARNAATSVIDRHCANTNSNRKKWLSAADAKLKKVHFYGSCHHNAEVPEGSTIETMEGRINLMKKDRIVLAYEEGTENYHVTDLVWEALMSGAVPAILGASNLESDIFPPHSALFASRYNDWDKFSNYVQQVADSKDQWESFQSWRTNETALADFERKLNFTKTSSQCRLCRWAYAKQYGLGWDHNQQQVRENAIPKQFCVSSRSNHVVKPFVESWHGGMAPNEPATIDEEEEEECGEKKSHLLVDAFGFRRTVWNHDGFTDMTFRQLVHSEADSPPTVLRIKINVHNLEGAIFHNVHTLVPNTIRTKYISSAAIQDERAKVTLLANWPIARAGIRSPTEGLLEIDLPQSFATGMWGEFKLRILTEDFDDLHDKLTEYFPSSYGKLVMKDFIDPIELFRVVS